ncbi:CaiB/BaiF CoA-transferase family protein [Gryllotalpicola koreensis]|uniref:CaiB/BaiF CoA-transferase family protein n=1 Tax=Gryllotalpicola koreensis TaxID=993086 RepID=A0ABP7ZYW2_9MICO
MVTSAPSGLGPLSGLRVLEFAGIGPGPHACILLADLGADVVRVQRPGTWRQGRPDPFGRGRQALVELDLKDAGGRAEALELVARADVLVEGFRPGVMEGLGLGPADAFVRNPRLVYGRMTGWGQEGPWSARAGHDINYISITGVLNAIGRSGERPVPPINLVGDYGGGSMFLLFGILAALYERQRSGEGQVVDAAMVDGAVALSHLVWASRGRGPALGGWSDERGTNTLDSGAPFYDVYETADGLYMAVGAIEPQFYAELLDGLGIDPDSLPPQHDRAHWPETKQRFADAFRAKTRAEWTDIFVGRDACTTPVLSFAEAPGNDHLAARSTFAEIDGVVQHRTAPRFSRTAPGAPGPGPQETTDAATIWRD